MTVLFAVLVVAFQNCGSNVKFGFVGLGQQIKGEMNGNGGTYEGKPEIDAYHFLPDFSCENRPYPFGHLQIRGETAVYFRSDLLRCDFSQETPVPQELDYSPFHWNLVGYREKIFERKEGVVDAIPDRLVEAWCFDDAQSKNLEIIQDWKRSDGTAQAKLYWRDAGVTTDLPSFQVSRVLDMSSVLYRGENYQLLIDKKVASPIPGQVTGRIQANIGGRVLDQSVSCRLGGYLDGRHWPAPLLMTGNITQFTVDRARSKVIARVTDAASKAYAVETPWTQPLNPLVRALTSLAPLFGGVLDFKLTWDDSALLMRMDDTVSGAFRLAKHDFASRQNQFLSDPLVNETQRVRPDYESLPSGVILYRDGAQDPTSDAEGWLRSVPLAGGTPTQLNHPLPLGGDYEIWSYLVSQPTGKIVYSASSPDRNLVLDVYSANLDGTSPIRLLAADTTTVYQNPTDELSLLGANQEFVLFDVTGLTQSSTGAPISTKSSRVASLDGTFQKTLNVPLAARSAISSPNGKIAYATEARTPGQGWLLSTETWQMIAAPLLRQGARFTSDGTRIIGLTVGKGALISIDVSTGQERSLCTSSNGSIGLMNIVNEQAIYLLEHLPASVAIRMWNGTECRKLNEVPLGSAPRYTFDLLIAPDERSAAVRVSIGKTVLSDTPGLAIQMPQFELFWLPLNGLTPIRVTWPLTPNGNVERAQFSADSSSLLYWGEQAEAGQRNLFLWRLPRMQ
ncbi:MAG: hypothetical protein NDI61_00280 [Bdellovibrionaceae bacterium]|nr:hypothetical protein [Pseudobdellovibrionaceae bacterium]